MKTHHAERTKDRAFTVTELIATVVMAGCLVLLAVPTLAKSESRGLSTACKSNLRLMMSAFHMYADENNSYFPGNEGFSNPGLTWIYEGNDVLNPSMTNYWSPRFNLFLPYLPPRQNVMRCPADTSVTRSRFQLPRPRSISMSHAVGTKGSSGHQRAPVDGMWLTGNHTANSQFYCYGKLSDIVAPNPAGLWIFIEEHPDSINDGAFGNVGPIPPNQYQLIDYPAAWHEGAAMITFADGHVEERKWIDSRTVPRTQSITITPQPNNPDVAWLANRTTAPVPR